MKIIASYKGNCITLGYAVASNNTIVTWYLPKFLNHHFINATVEKRDFHITYPRDGNAHTSYKYFDPATNQYYEKRVYYDEVVIKEFDNDKVFKGFSKSARNYQEIDQMMAVRYLPEPFSTVPLLYEFPQSGGHVTDQFLTEIITPCKNVGVDDIELPLEGLEGTTFNLGFYLYDLSRVNYIRQPEKTVFSHRIKAFGHLFIEGYILVAV
jgi:hypothetical protein